MVLSPRRQSVVRDATATVIGHRGRRRVSAGAALMATPAGGTHGKGGEEEPQGGE